MLGADRAEATSSASSLTTTRCSAAQSFMVIWLMAGGAPLAPPGPPSSPGSQPPTPEPAVKGRPTAERGHQGRPRRRSAGDLRGRAVFRNDHLRAGDGVTPTDEGVKRGPTTVLPRWSPSHRACRRRCGMQLTALGQGTPLSDIDEPWCGHEGFMIAIMNPL